MRTDVPRHSGHGTPCRCSKQSVKKAARCGGIYKEETYMNGMDITHFTELFLGRWLLRRANWVWNQGGGKNRLKAVYDSVLRSRKYSAETAGGACSELRLFLDAYTHEERSLIDTDYLARKLIRLAAVSSPGPQRAPGGQRVRAHGE